MRHLLLLNVLVFAGCGRMGFAPAQSNGQSDVDADTNADGPGDRAADASIDAAPDADLRILGPGVWATTPASPVPARFWTSGVWTGTEFVVVGGALDNPGYNATATGARYNPSTKQWNTTSETNALATHSSMTAWSGQEVLVYGGAMQYTAVANGVRYNPITDTWTPMSTVGQPGARMYAVNAWTGSGWMLWGGWSGSHNNSGASYNPATDTWTTMSTAGAPSPRSFSEGVWTGTELIVWGGCDGAMGACAGVKGDGAAYNPTTNTWRTLSSVGAPSARAGHTAVWTGSEMIIWGGATGGNFSPAVNDGARYNPVTDSWRPITLTGAPSARAAFGAGWLHDKMVVWGPFSSIGGLYDPATDQWSQLQFAGAPTGRQRFAFAIGDRSVFVWGGFPLDGAGAVWTPQ